MGNQKLRNTRLDYTGNSAEVVESNVLHKYTPPLEGSLSVRRLLCKQLGTLWQLNLIYQN